MSKYEEISDFEINTAVVKALRLPFKAEFCNVFLDHGFDEGAFVYTRVDYCNNPSDAWPIIVDNKIGVSPHGEKWMANNFNPSSVGSYQVQTMSYDKNPLRAAMIVFLMMREAK